MTLRIIASGAALNSAPAERASGRDTLSRSVERVSSGLYFQSILASADQSTLAVESARGYPINLSRNGCGVSLLQKVRETEAALSELHTIKTRIEELITLFTHYKGVQDIPVIREALENTPSQKVVALFETERAPFQMWKVEAFRLDELDTDANAQEITTANLTTLQSHAQAIEQMIVTRQKRLIQALVARENTSASFSDPKAVSGLRGEKHGNN